MKLIGPLYIAAGIGAFLISATIEYYFFESVTRTAGFSFFIVGIFETAKILTILITRTILLKDQTTITTHLAVLGWGVKAFLVIISLVCSIGFLSSNLDRPHLQEVRERDSGRAESLYNEQYANLKEQQESALNRAIAEIKDRYKKRYDKLSEYYEPKIAEAEQLKDLEFNNEVNGVRRGARYYEHQRKLTELSNKYNREKEKLLSEENKEIRNFTEQTNDGYQKRFDNLENNRETRLNQIEQNSYADDERVANTLVASFLSTLKEGLNIEMEYLTFSILFSLLVSFTLEGLIYIIFNNLAIFYTTNPDSVQPGDDKSLKDFLNQNIHVAGFSSQKPSMEGVSDGPY